MVNVDNKSVISILRKLYQQWRIQTGGRAVIQTLRLISFFSNCWNRAVIFSNISLVAHCYSIEPVEDLFRCVK